MPAQLMTCQGDHSTRPNLFKSMEKMYGKHSEDLGIGKTGDLQITLGYYNLHDLNCRMEEF